MTTGSEQLHRRQSHTPMFINFVVGTVVLLAILACGESSTSGNSGSNGGSAPTATASGPKAGTVLQTFSGSGPKKTSTFTVPDGWTLKYTCQADANAQSLGASGILIVSVNGSDNSPIDPAAVNVQCGNTAKSDSTVEHQSGTVYLDANSANATWTLTVVAGG